MLFGIDIHPQFQAGLSIEQAVSEGICFLSVKVSEGVDSSYLAMGSADWIRRAKALGIPVVGYHYLRPGNETAQAQVFAAALRTAGCPGVLDAEAVQVINGITTPTLTISGIRAFVTAARVAGANIALLYLPRWYHALLGSPLLAGLPPLWGSAYVSGVAGPPAVQYAAASARGWVAYGGKDVAVLQFTDRATVAGMAVDANAYLGTRAQFVALVGSSPGKDRTEMIALPATDMPKDPGSSPANWPQRNYNVWFDITGGWEGDAAFSFGVQDWAGPPSGTRGYLLLASWILPSANGAPQLVPVDPLYTAGRGHAIDAHGPTAAYRAPAGCVGVTLNYAAPGGAGVAIGRSA